MPTPLDPSRFSAEVPNHFLCEICQCVVLEPLEHAKCQRAFCKACIEEWIPKGKTCPHCRQDASIKDFNALHRVLREQLGELKLKCKNAPACSSVVALSGLDKHEKSCTVSACAVPGCSFKGFPKDVEAHMKNTAEAHVNLLLATLKKKDAELKQKETELKKKDQEIQKLKKESPTESSRNPVRASPSPPTQSSSNPSQHPSAAAASASSSAASGVQVVKNTEEVPAKLGHREGSRATLYCGRRLGVQAIPHSDGRCGVGNGPQCNACRNTVLKNGKGDTVTRGPTGSASANLLFCGKAKNNIACSAGGGAKQCEDCAALWRQLPKWKLGD
uniref:RING-type domain-containing protein n=1 Tax=Chromera velia CCMP2878 TaxID=1169474 RepID=A0A0G4H691_9ALVE|eukprot:Cvel_24858.t1-p1 / transcript=Cvel_24858.t1 / gene=Cvel_24858 / organism=Chromera_velia_CCMP2878 / gene_product=E3 ubiquitin-protein ligase NRDP1, putative / transcript_product=E3 ubiquitin-protein ligase NRDP1, putative / location=Cvel_scaffold2744:17398-20175(+) / protein_length=330 / sequence_SO=supercontig / SO=protein_coding / is_pseudo=false